MDEPIVFVNIGWMVNYQGRRNDPTLGGHGWLKTHDYGHEAWNFQPHKGRLYGYVPRSARIDLRRLGGSARDEQLDGVTVVWVARSPFNRVTYVAGWFRSASVHREHDRFKVPRSQGEVVKYQIQAPVKGAKLLKPDQRVIEVPTAKKKGNLGQSPVWYGNPTFVKRVRRYLKAGGIALKARNSKRFGTPRRADPEERKRIELAAVRHATKYYESRAGGGRLVQPVHKDNFGWDLNVKGGDVTLKVEVKGLSGRQVCVELTPNEYKQMQSPEHRTMYVVYVVTKAGEPTARAHVFYYNSEASSQLGHVWMTEDGRTLKIEPMTAARLTVK
jgi:Domain of unknown function (DUF3883)